MKRKSFLSSIIPAALAGSNISASLAENKPGCTTPPYLQKNDVIGITSPAGFITIDEIQPAIKKIEQWGYKVHIGKTIGKRDNSFGGTDEERKNDMQQMLDDKNIKAIMCARGGYGSIRIVDDLNFDQFKKHPKWIIGFSDITVLHNHIFQNFHIASIHSKMCNSFPTNWEAADEVQKKSIESINDILSGKSISYTAPANKFNMLGNATGRLIGGNLRTLENIAGSKSSPDTRNAILFVEDTGEYLYSIDRMFYNLLRSNKLQHLKGLIIGGFKIKPDDAGEEFGRSLEEIVLEKAGNFGYPICFDFPVGHQKYNVALNCGAMHKLVVNDQGTTLHKI